MAVIHPDVEAEQAYIDRAYARLEESRQAAARLSSMVEVGRGGTSQARWEREMIQENISHRLAQLHLGDAPLCFGRIDQDSGDSFYIGRIAVADEHQDPLIVDWRAPVAEPFYRATGREPLGLSRRRHFAVKGRTLLGIEDEFFGEAANGLLDGTLSGQGALVAALEANRTGKLSDIVATIQGEQDEIIRADLRGVLVVQGGPGTGKTVVALHRAAYLMYTHRFPLEGQGVLMIGPNRLFVNYIDHVLPSLGEAGVELVVLADLIDTVRVKHSDKGRAARVKGDLRSAEVLARAVRDRERSLRDDLVIGHGAQTLRLTVADSAAIVAEARRRYRTHNAARPFVQRRLFEVLAASGRHWVEPRELGDRLRRSLAAREALEWMWPVLTPAQLLHDLLGSRALLRSASRGLLSRQERQALFRPRSAADEVIWTTDDVPLLDEARALLGARPGSRGEDAVRTYGHIVVDEAQDLSPMQLRMIRRRSLNGSMTVVGDIAQATGMWAHESWDEILEHLPARHPHRQVELTVGYRIPAPMMDVANRVLALAAPQLTPARAVRELGDPPTFVAATSVGGLGAAVVEAAVAEADRPDSSTVAVICPDSLVEPMTAAFAARGVIIGVAYHQGLELPITVIAVGMVKGLEVDAAVVVEPAAIIEEEPQGLRSLYVGLTRATKRLTVVHARELPTALG